jgi:hypothetical protein
MSLRDAAGWSGMLGLGSLSNPAVKYRLDNSVEFLEAVTAHLLAARSASQALHWPGRTIRVADGTCISKPGSKGTDWRVHGVYDLGAGGFSNLELTDVKGAETLTYGAPVVGEVRIGDRNYGRAKPWHRFLQDSGGKADLIVRIKWNGFHLTGQDGSAFDLIDHLATLPNDHLPHEIDVQALVRRGVTTPIRLIILRKPPEAVEATRKTLHAQANRKQRVLDPRTLIAAEFLILGTSLPFKRLKSLLHIDKLPARTDLGARSWLYPHLILALLCDDLSQVFLEFSPQDLFDAEYLPSLWTAQKVAVWALVDAIRGPITIQAMMRVTGDIHKSFANAPRKRKPHVKYPRRRLF